MGEILNNELEPLEGGLEGEVDAEVEGVVGVEGNELLRELAYGMVHTCEEVKARGVDVEHPTECCTICAYRSVYTY